MFVPLRESRRNPVPVLPRDCSKLLRLHPWRLGSEYLRLLQRWGIQDAHAPRCNHQLSLVSGNGIQNASAVVGVFIHDLQVLAHNLVDVGKALVRSQRQSSDIRMLEF